MERERGGVEWRKGAADAAAEAVGMQGASQRATRRHALPPDSPPLPVCDLARLPAATAKSPPASADVPLAPTLTSMEPPAPSIEAPVLTDTEPPAPDLAEAVLGEGSVAQ